MSFFGTFVQNVAYKSIGELIIRLLSFVFIVYVARTMGDQQFGILNFALSFVLLFVVIIDFGLSPLLVRNAARDPQHTRKLFLHLVFLKSILAVFFFGAVILVLQLLAVESATFHVVLWIGVFVMLNSFTELINAVFHAHQKMQYEALVMSLQKVGLVLTGLAAITVGMGLNGVAIAYAFSGCIGLAAAVVLLKKKNLLAGSWKWSAGLIQQTWREAVPLTVTTLFINIYFRIDITLLTKIRSSAEAGWYGAAHKCIEVLMVIPAIVVVAAFPGFAKLFYQNRDKLLQVSAKVLKLLLILGAPLAGGTWIVAQPLMVLLFGEDYAPAGAALSWLALALGIIFLNYALSFLLISCERQIVNAVASGLAVLVSIGMNLMLIPRLGHVGAAISAAVTEGFLFVAYFGAVRGLLFPIPFAKITGKVFLSAALMASAVVWFRHLHVLWVILIAAVVYGAALLVTRAVDVDDFMLLKKIVSTKT